MHVIFGKTDEGYKADLCIAVGKEVVRTIEEGATQVDAHEAAAAAAVRRLKSMSEYPENQSKKTQKCIHAALACLQGADAPPQCQTA